MCIFTGKIHPIVSNTKIFVTLVGRNKQLTIYQNSIKQIDSSNIAMILPIPGKGYIQMMDMSEYPMFFDDLGRDLPYDPFAGTLSLRRESSKVEYIPIQRVGAYDVSVVSSLEAMEALDWTHFHLKKSVLRVLEKYYAANFSFCVARLRDNVNGSAIHPLAYIHELPLRNDNIIQLFIPTRHEGHHADDNYTNTLNHKWDHAIYVYGIMNNPYYQQLSGTRFYYMDMQKLLRIIRNADYTATILRPNKSWLFLKGIFGNHKNCDLSVELNEHQPLNLLPISEDLSYDNLCFRLGVVFFISILIYSLLDLFFFKIFFVFNR